MAMNLNLTIYYSWLRESAGIFAKYITWPKCIWPASEWVQTVKLKFAGAYDHNRKIRRQSNESTIGFLTWQREDVYNKHSLNRAFIDIYMQILQIWST